MRLPDKLFVGVPASITDAAPPATEHIEISDYAELPDAKGILGFTGQDRALTMLGWHVLTHKRNHPRYEGMVDPPPAHAAVGHFDRSRWTDEAWEQLDALARATDVMAVVFQTPATFKAGEEHATRLENFVAHGMRPGLALAWEWAPRAWPTAKALELCDRIGAIPVLDPTEHPVPDGELVYLRFRGGSKGRTVLRDDDLKKVALEVRDRIGWVVFSNATGAIDAERFAQMI
jgi:hypothetical protein